MKVKAAEFKSRYGLRRIAAGSSAAWRLLRHLHPFVVIRRTARPKNDALSPPHRRYHRALATSVYAESAPISRPNTSPMATLVVEAR